ncbi:DeoR/GlpR transcriptional regulator [Alginatibacterium sediminis]|uniref:DeoR/GlpR transcriptional regulator n=1 Tax=Alginatibacterium sediminis TaxID=2164068 RepID=A0A420EHA6_9ALTE|nr:DeoR/GlpR family DNA-binding transcription regulator [Alginatibacterium sediminis]RKF20079.1 DeoR/GlpR transcriptional regulator [Alginatibacterium sediminis]
MNALRRREKILALLTQHGSVEVKTLVTTFNNSEVTIRGDLRKLEKEGKLIRYHGGAQSVDSLPNTLRNDDEINLDSRFDLNTSAKHRIAERAAQFADPGASVIFDSGSTTHLVAAEIAKRGNIFAITNNLPVADVFVDAKDVSIVISGGTYRSKTKSLHGPMAEQSLMNVTADLLFVGADGIDADKGITTFNDGYSISQVMANCAKLVVAVVDSSKFGRIGFNKVLNTADINYLITDNQVSENDIQAFSKLGVTVIVV